MIRPLSLAVGLLMGSAIHAQSGIRLTLEEAQAVAAERAYAVRYAGFDKDQAASTTRETIASGFPQVSGSIEYNRYIDIPTQVSSGDMFGFPDYLTTFLGGVAQATGVPLDAPPTDPDAIQEFQFGAEQTMTAGFDQGAGLFGSVLGEGFGLAEDGHILVGGQGGGIGFTGGAPGVGNGARFGGFH